MMKIEPNKLGIYVQVPFCQTKCTYCNFHTGVVSAGRFAPYVEAVCREIRGYRELYQAAGVALPAAIEKAVADTLYFGGGTPSLLEPGLLQAMINAIRETFATELNEVTLEADPETVEVGKAEAWVRAGLTGLVLGCSRFQTGNWWRRGGCIGERTFTELCRSCVRRGFGISVLI
jgi:oxygen-independent coproporphyrinogen-3 oxidase